MYEKLPKKEYLKLHKEYEMRGLAIPSLSEVMLTDWGIQNGLKAPRNKCRKINNSKNRNISILEEGKQQAKYYWAGFWKIAS